MLCKISSLALRRSAINGSLSSIMQLKIYKDFCRDITFDPNLAIDVLQWILIITQEMEKNNILKREEKMV